MTLADHALAAGRTLFRWRSYVPLLFLPAFVLTIALDRPPFTAPAALLAWQIGCVLVALAGIAVRAHVVGHAAAGTSGRNQAEQKAQSLTTTGFYSVVRHPLYLGNALVLFGLSLLPVAWYLPVIVVLGAALYYERIMLVEEDFLAGKYGEAFRRWAQATPAIVPALRGWTPPALPFAWRIVVRAEIYGVFQIVAVVFVLDVVQRWSLTGEASLSPVWTPAALATAAVWVLARYARKYTRLLTVPGR